MMIVGKHLCLMQFEAFGQIMPLSLQKTGVTWESKGTQETTLSPPTPGERVAYGCIRPYSRTTVVNNFYSTLKSFLGRHIAVHPAICHTVNNVGCYTGMPHTPALSIYVTILTGIWKLKMKIGIVISMCGNQLLQK